MMLKGSVKLPTSVMVSSVDIKQFKKLSIQATFEAVFEKNIMFFAGKSM